MRDVRKMPPGWIFKIVVDGPSGSGKTSILKATCNNGFKEDYSRTIGLNFFIKTIERDNDLACKLQLWDLNRTPSFKHTHLHSYRGSSALLLFFDVSDPHSFKKLPSYINEANRTLRNNVPIYLIGAKEDLGVNVNLDHLQELIEDFEISAFYLISLKNAYFFEEILTTLSQDLIERNSPSYTHTEEEMEEFKEFYSLFSTCPVCGRRNHENYLIRFYFSEDSSNITLKERLLTCYDRLEYRHEDNIRLGIPCCSCFSRFFKTH